jgi:hypothetical protein
MLKIIPKTYGISVALFCTSVSLIALSYVVHYLNSFKLTTCGQKYVSLNLLKYKSYQAW